MPDPLSWGKKAREEADKELKETEKEQKEIQEELDEAAKIAKMLDKL